jgi:phytoene desaturase
MATLTASPTTFHSVATGRDDRPHALVIGAGVGGLAAAIRLGAKGYRVTVVDRLDAPGGRAYTYRQDGFTFDAGPTIITAPYIFEELWTLCGQRMADHVELRPSDPFYRITFDDGQHFTYCGDHARMRAEVARLSPEDVEGYDRYLQVSADIYKVAFEELADKPFHSLGFTLSAAKDLVRLQGYKSVYTRVSKFFRNEHLRTVFSFHPLLIGGNPFTATSYYCLIAHLESKYGVHYAVGGTGALVRGMVDLIEGLGGTVQLNADVDRIEVTGGRATGVTLADGTHIAADLVVSNAEPAWTYSKLLRHHPRKRWTDRKLARARHSMGLVVWYFGTNRRFDDVLHHNMILGPRYKGLLDDIFHRHVLAEDCSLYLHRPTASDPSLAPPGCDAFYVLAPVPNLASGTDWARQAEPYRALIQRRLESTLLPGLGSTIVTSRMLTPQDFRDRYLALNGAAFAMEPRLLQSAWFRPHNRSEEVEGLYLVGAGTHPGAGLPGVVSSARVVDSLIPHASQFARRQA